MKLTKNTSLTCLSPAKLNLFLHITGKREDGYHDLQTVFRLLNWGDEMRFVINETSLIHFKGGKKSIIDSMVDYNQAGSDYLSLLPIRLYCDVQLTNQLMDNLIIKSACALLDFANRKKMLPPRLPIIDIYLDKKIPTGAGLGGGSSNAATTLLALNELWQLDLSNAQLQQIATILGADVAFFIYAQFHHFMNKHDKKECIHKNSGSVIAEGIGEIFTPIELPAQKFLLLTPSAHISTAKLFAHSQLQRNYSKLSTETIGTRKADFLNQLNAPFCNVFQPVVCELSEAVAEALAYLRQLESMTDSTARMTGSGSCVFLPLPKHLDKQTLDSWVADSPCSAIVVTSSTDF